jgi:hypothetical protein
VPQPSPGSRVRPSLGRPPSPGGRPGCHACRLAAGNAATSPAASRSIHAGPARATGRRTGSTSLSAAPSHRPRFRLARPSTLDRAAGILPNGSAGPAARFCRPRARSASSVRRNPRTAEARARSPRPVRVVVVDAARVRTCRAEDPPRGSLRNAATNGGSGASRRGVSAHWAGDLRGSTRVPCSQDTPCSRRLRPDGCGDQPQRPVRAAPAGRARAATAAAPRNEMARADPQS